MNAPELYQSLILRLSREPSNKGPLPAATHSAEGANPACGDEVTLHLEISPQGTITQASFTGQSCAICTASASLLCREIQTLSTADAARMAEALMALVTDGAAPCFPLHDDLLLLETVRSSPRRTRCVTLPWEALQATLQNHQAG